MVRSISEVARMAGVSARTLRHYDTIGLLRPTRVGANGYRWYGRAELRRLQHILLLRGLGCPLDQIRQVLEGEADEAAALRRHRAQLAVERDRLDRLLVTVDRTLADLQGTDSVSDEEFFAGFRDRRDRLRDDLVGRYGPGVGQHFTAAAAATQDWSRADHEQAADSGRELLRRLSVVRVAGSGPRTAVVLDLVAEHYQAVRRVWPADAAAYHALADLVVDHPEQRAIIAEVDPDLPEWLADAIRAYAQRRLGFRPPRESRRSG